MIKQRSEQFLKDHGIEDWGNFNVAPTPYEKIDSEDMDIFWRQIHTWGMSKEQELRQVRLDEEYIESVHILIWHNVIYMLKFNTRREGDRWRQIPSIYRVGCKHEYTEEKISRWSDYRATCKKCGYSYSYNSGD